jgi:hypothetical protein
MLLSEARARKRQKAKQRELKSFIALLPVAITHEEFLQHRAVYIYCRKRLSIIERHRERHAPEIESLQGTLAEILHDCPNISAGLHAEQLMGTSLEI